MVSDDLADTIEHYRTNPEPRTGQEYPCVPDLEQFVEYWEEREDISQRTLVLYLRYLAHIDFAVDDRELDDDGEQDREEAIEHLERFKKWAEEQAAERFTLEDLEEDDDKDEDDIAHSRIRYIYYSYCAYKAYLRSIDREDLIEHLPESQKFTKPKSNPQTNKYEPSQVEDMLNAAPNERIRLAGALLFYAGMRSIEVLHCTAEWFDFTPSDKIEVTIPAAYAKGSDNEPEYTAIRKEFEDDLKAYIASRYGWEGTYEELVQKLADDEEDEYEYEELFTENGSIDTLKDLWSERYYLRKRLTEAAERAGINDPEKVAAHAFRRSFIHDVHNRLVRQGKNVVATSKVARHADPATTAKHYLAADKQEQMNLWSKAYGD